MDELYESLVDENQVIKLNEKYYTKKGIKNDLLLQELLVRYVERIPELDVNIIENARKLMTQFGVIDTYLGIYDAYTSKSNDDVTKSNGLEIQQVIRILSAGYVEDYNREAGKGGVFPGWMKSEYDQCLAKKYNLLETYGSDFHNPETDYIGIEINQDNCEKIRESMVLRRKI